MRGKGNVTKFFAGVGAVVCLIWAASGYSQMGGRHGGGMRHGHGMRHRSMVRHHFVRHHGIDPRYAAKVNPLNATAANLQEGKRLYEQHCTICHGPTGGGDGEAGKTLTPPPPNIAALGKMPTATDGYVYWTIAEGGVPVGTAMPPFKNLLKEDEIWKLILYLREF
jgi:hypothetical protein